LIVRHQYSNYTRYIANKDTFNFPYSQVDKQQKHRLKEWLQLA